VKSESTNPLLLKRHVLTAKQEKLNLLRELQHALTALQVATQIALVWKTVLLATKAFTSAVMEPQSVTHAQPELSLRRQDKPHAKSALLAKKVSMGPRHAPVVVMIAGPMLGRPIALRVKLIITGSRILTRKS